MNELTPSEFNIVAEEIHAIFVEAELASREIVIDAYHAAGTKILELPGDLRENLQRVAQKIGRSDRMLYYAVKLARKYKTTAEIPMGKNISMRKIIREQLTTPKEKAEHIHTPITICSSCKERLDNEI